MTEDEAKRSADALSLIANPIRLLMIKALAGEELSVGKLAGMLGLSHSAASQHLKRLRTSGLLVERRDAQFRYYAVKPAVAGVVLRLVSLAEEHEFHPQGQQWRSNRRPIKRRPKR